MPTKNEFETVATESLETVAGGASRVASRSNSNSDITQLLTQVTGSIALDPDATRVIAGGTGFVAVLDATNLDAGPLAITSVPDHEVTGAVWLPGGLFATAGREGTVRIWNLETAAPLASATVSSPIDLVSDGDATLYTSGPDGYVRALACR